MCMGRSYIKSADQFDFLVVSFIVGFAIVWVATEVPSTQIEICSKGEKKVLFKILISKNATKMNFFYFFFFVTYAVKLQRSKNKALLN